MGFLLRFAGLGVFVLRFWFTIGNLRSQDQMAVSGRGVPLLVAGFLEAVLLVVLPFALSLRCRLATSMRKLDEIFLGLSFRGMVGNATILPRFVGVALLIYFPRVPLTASPLGEVLVSLARKRRVGCKTPGVKELAM